jgi:hypothetical protein
MEVQLTDVEDRFESLFRGETGTLLVCYFKQTDKQF